MTCLYVILFWMYKCGYANCAICKNAIKNSEHWGHIRLHHGHENHGPPPPLPQTSFENRQQQHQSNSRSNNKKFGRGFADAIQLQVGKGYEVDTTQIGGYGDGIARIQDCVIFIKGGHIREKVRIIITETRRRFAIARTA